ncbi:MAG: ion channel [Pseudomonadota bacterium]
MTGQLTLGFLFTCVTIGMAVGFIVILFEALDYSVPRLAAMTSPVRDAIILFFSIVWMMIGIVTIVFAWALLFLHLGLFTGLEEAFYFALISTTTVGYGDVILPEPSRILAGFAAADGFIIFGLDTAVLFEILRQLRVQRTGTAAP